MSRPTFLLHSYPVRACGITFYAFNEGKMFILLMKTPKWYEDIGGKTDIGDPDPFFTAARETNEESNRLFEFDEIYQSVQNAQVTISKKSKYSSFYIEIPWFENTSIFGINEEYEHNDRIFEWVDVSNMHEIKRNPRLDMYWLKTVRKICKIYGKWV